MLLTLLLGAGLRFHALARDVRLHPDEALFSTFARAAAINGEWLLPGPLDKTPMAIYINALAQVWVGEGEFAARLPGTLASILLMAAIYALAKALYQPNNSVPVIALLLVACSPFAIAFSASALTDGPMLLCITLALWLVAWGRWGWSGLLLGMGFASKQQALFYLPLVLALGWAVHSSSALRAGTRLQRAARFSGGLGLIVLILLVWDNAREGDSLFTLAAANNNPARLIRANEVLPRLQLWLDYGGTLLGQRWLTLLLTAGAVGSLVYRVIHAAQRRKTLVDLLLLTYLLAYAGLHWLVAFNTYDRYLLPLLPLVILLTARGLSLMQQTLVQHPVLMQFSRAALLLALLVSAAGASSGQSAIHNKGVSYGGIDTLAAYLNSKPVATVIYDHWLGWPLDYYLGAWHDKRRVYYPTPDALAADALRLPETGARYLPAPADQPAGRWLEALCAVGFHITEDYRLPRFVVYELIPPWVMTDAANAEARAPGQSRLCSTVLPP